LIDYRSLGSCPALPVFLRQSFAKWLAVSPGFITDAAVRSLISSGAGTSEVAALAEVLGTKKELARALALIGETMAQVDRGGDMFYLPGLLRGDSEDLSAESRWAGGASRRA
jgi:hypothetical protein